MTDSDQPTSLDVLILAEDFYPKKSGGAFIDWNVATHLADQGDSVTVVTPRSESTPSAESINNVEIRRPFRTSNSDIHPNSFRGILRRLLFLFLVFPYLIYIAWKRDFDVVYSTNHLFHPIASFICSFFSIPHVSFVGYTPSIQDKELAITNPLFILERINFRLFMGSQTLCRTPSVYNLLSEISDTNIARIDGIVDDDAVIKAIEEDDSFSQDYKLNAEKQLIFVGRLEDLKNPSKLPPLIAQLSSEYSLLVVGDGSRRATLETAIHEAEVEDQIHLAGRLPHKQTLQAIYQSDILILPSKTESYGAVVFEALSLNTPVLATPVGVLPAIEHPKLTTVPLEEFSDVIPDIDHQTKDGVDYKTLDQFSVRTFTRDVRHHLFESVNEY